MVRTQIQLTEEQAKKLRELSVADREAVAALIRQAVDQFIVTGKPDRSALYRLADAVVGKYKSDSGDISIHHDRYRFAQDDYCRYIRTFCAQHPESKPG